jgi:hypothetical protein
MRLSVVDVAGISGAVPPRVATAAVNERTEVNDKRAGDESRNYKDASPSKHEPEPFCGRARKYAPRSASGADHTNHPGSATIRDGTAPLR